MAKHSNETKAAALAALRANGGNVKLTAAQVGVARTTLADWARGLGTGNVPPALVENAETTLADRLEAISARAAGLLEGKLDDAKPVQLATIIGICVDKFRLLRGQATGISGREEMSDEERWARMQELLRRVQARRAAAEADEQPNGSQPNDV